MLLFACPNVYMGIKCAIPNWFRFLPSPQVTIFGKMQQQHQAQQITLKGSYMAPLFHTYIYLVC